MGVQYVSVSGAKELVNHPLGSDQPSQDEVEEGQTDVWGRHMIGWELVDMAARCMEGFWS